mmetsp:Transcript_2031/g.4230  ORF Transcript_2031/g.4230 Transcript_2031/m.4230 type:complete len:208 (-) Transcript_2031:205-828(-)|eukprot:CAMPEP_0197284040 /NCGR_PEP_ID=MMETSP1432-20130617/25236_1 /TAXON_ID=44447 /ORGANISM="Pseudo-nitzschia delicatissima, Strain UNC1205" /LENGTH=207 /DNA_ID=CAMNT_0042751039 /DNA_START=236 /DNA_END=859 /DNA_ORIENTATION=+
MSSSTKITGSIFKVVSPSDSTTAFGLVAPSPTGSIQPTDADILCGRGKGIRKHPGNEFYNRLLRENYDEYKSAPKGTKVSIVKKILTLVKDQQGRFLECKSEAGRYVYTDIGDERALNKTSQAFRDIRATIEKHHLSLTNSSIHKKSTPCETSSTRTPRRPTFRERLAMLEREQEWKTFGNQSENEETSEEEEVSDTETEESFQMNK